MNPSQPILLFVEDNLANLMLVEQIIEGHPRISMMSASEAIRVLRMREPISQM